VVPLAYMNYLPAGLILERGAPSAWHWLSPAVGVLFLGMSLQVWQFGVWHSHSTGS
jgi:ABC-2 type transport system permease protein